MSLAARIAAAVLFVVWTPSVRAQTPSVPQRVLSFGGDDRAAAPWSQDLAGAFTVEFWARRAQTGRADYALMRGSLGPNSPGIPGGGNRDRLLTVGFGADNRFLFGFYADDLWTNAAYTDTDWHHWAVTWHRGGSDYRRIIYRDGVEVAQDRAFGSLDQLGNEPLEIGRGLVGSFSGELDEVRVWNYARDGSAIAANKGLTLTSEAGLLASWSFDGATPYASLTGGHVLTPDGAPVLRAQQATADVSLRLLPSTNYPALGEALTLNVRVQNDGPDDVTNVVVSAPLPGGLRYASTGGDGTYDTATGRWTAGPVAAGETRTLQLRATYLGAPVRVTAEVIAQEARGARSFRDPDSQPGNGVAGEDDQESQFVGAQPSQGDRTALAFDGVTGFGEVPFHEALSTATSAGAFTAEAWIRPDAARLASSQAPQDLMGRWYTTVAGAPTSESGWVLRLRPDRRIEASTRSQQGAVTTLQSTTSLPVGAWAHVAMVYEGTTLRLYVNGAPAGSLLGAARPYHGSLPLRFGASAGDGAQLVAPYKGLMRDLRLWSSARTATQIRQGTFRSLSGTETGLMSVYDLGEIGDLGAGTRSGNDAVDRSPGVHHADIVGGATIANASLLASTPDLFEDRVAVTWPSLTDAAAQVRVLRDGLPLALVAGASLTYADPTGTLGANYTYCALVLSGAGEYPLGCALGRRQLAAPGAMAASDGAFTGFVRVLWTDRSALETAYRVYRSGIRLTTLPVGASSFDDATAVAGTAYRYCVRPVQGDVEGPEACDDGTRASTVQPASVAASDAQHPGFVLVGWVNQGTRTDAFRVYRSPTGGPQTRIADLTDSTATTFRDYTGEAGATYTYCVARVSGGAESIQVCDAGSHGTLAVPTGVAATDDASETEVSVSWRDLGPLEDGYRVGRRGGSALVLDGTDDYVSAPGLSELPPSWTIELWARRDAAGGAGCLITHGRLSVCYGAANTFAVDFGGDERTVAFDPGTAWHHYAVTYDRASGRRRLYLDGAKVDSAVVSAPYAGAATFEMGRASASGGYFRGQIDEVRVWSVERTAGEVRGTMTQAATRAMPRLTALWHFDEGSGSAATETARGHLGTLVGAPTWTESLAPLRQHGQNPAVALGDDGPTGEGALGSLAPLALPDSFTVEFWARRAALGAEAVVAEQSAAGLAIRFDAAGRLVLQTGATALTTPQALADLNWHHWAVTYSATHRRIYRDGVLMAEGTGGGLAARAAGVLRVGYALSGATAGGFFRGRLDELRLWNSVRTPTEIAIARHRALIGDETGLAAYWPLDAVEPLSGGASPVRGALDVTSGGAHLGAQQGLPQAVAGRPFLVEEVVSGFPSVSDATAEAGVLYRYCVEAFTRGGAGTGAESACDDGRRRSSMSAPTASATDGRFEDRIDISWTNPSTRTSLFRLFRGGDLVQVLSGDVLTFADREATAGVTYTYCVVAVASDGTASDATGAACVPGRRELLPAGSFTATDDGESRVELSWADNSQAEDGYRIYRRAYAADGTLAPDSALVLALSANRVALVDTLGAPGTLYRYALVAFQGDGASVPAFDAGQRTLLAPTDLVATDGTSETAITLTWTDHSKFERGYEVWRREITDPATGALAPDSVLVTATAFNVKQAADSTIATGLHYRYGVYAFDRYNYRTVNGAVVYTTGRSLAALDRGHTILTPPGGVGASDTYTDRIEVRWSDRSARELGYRVTRDGAEQGYLLEAKPGFAISRSSISGTWGQALFTGSTATPFWVQTRGFRSMPTSWTVEMVYARQANTSVSRWMFSQGPAEANKGIRIGFNDSDFGPSCAIFGFVVRAGGPNNLEVNHLACTFDAATKTLTAILNGQATSGVAPSAYLGSGVTETTIGASLNGANRFEGYVDEVRVWNYARTVSQINANRSAPIASSQTGLVAYWQFEIGSIIYENLDTPSYKQLSRSSAPMVVQGEAFTDWELGAGTASQRTYGVRAVAERSQSVTVSDVGVRLATAPVAVVRQTHVAATDGSVVGRVLVTWTDNGVTATKYEIYRDGTKIGEGEALARSFSDGEAPGGDLAEYCVASLSGSTVQWRACDVGWTPAAGRVAGRISTQDGAGVDGARVCVTGGANSALLLDGTGGNVEGPVMDLGGSEITIEYWFKGSSLQSPVRQQNANGFIAAGWGTGPHRHILSNDGGTNGIAVGAAATNGQWHHVAMTWKQGATNGFVSYLDGVLVEQRNASATPIPSLSANLFLGSYAGTGEFTNGQLDEVRIWKRARTQAEIQATMRVPLTGTEQGLVAYYQMDQGAGPFVMDRSASGAHGAIRGGAFWQVEGAPSDRCSRTDLEGNYVLANVLFGTGRSVEVRPELGTHVFQPAYRTVALNRESPTVNGVEFTDVSAFGVGGTVVFASSAFFDTATCPAPGVNLLVDGTLKGVNETNGTFSLSLLPRTAPYAISARLDGHGFTPASRSVTVSGDVGGLVFTDTTTRRLGLYAGGSRGISIGDVRLRVSATNGCFSKEVTVTGTSALRLPAQPYRVEVVGVTLAPGSTLDYAEVLSYFNQVGPQEVDLSARDTTLAMTYRAPLRVTVTGFPTTTGNGAQTCAAPDRLGVPTLQSGTFFPLVIEVVEDYGNATAVVDEMQVRIYDEVGDRISPAAIDTLIRAGRVAFQGIAGAPNVLRGRMVDGVDRSYQKYFQVDVQVGERTATATQWAIVTGQKVRPGTFVPLSTEQVPLFILRDPPGDASYSYLEKDTEICHSMQEWMINNELGFVSSFRSFVGASAEVGLGYSTEATASSGVASGQNVLLKWRREGGTNICISARERFATSNAPNFVGEDADVYVGTAINLLFAQTDELKVDGATCAIDLKEGYAVRPDPSNPLTRAYAYTHGHIRDVVVPSLERLRDAASATPRGDTPDYNLYIRNWQKHLLHNQYLKTASPQAAGQPDQRSFSGGAEYGFQSQSDSTYHHAWSIHMFNDTQLGYGQEYKFAGNGFESTWKLQFTRENLVALPGFLGVGPRSQSLRSTRTVGYVLKDTNAGDYFSVNVRPERSEEIDVFIPNASTEAAATGFGAVGGILGSVGGILTPIKLYRAYVQYSTNSAISNANPALAVIGPGLGIAFGLAQGLYDLSAMLNPQAVVSGRVDRKVRIPFGSPVFELVAGASSCPWESGVSDSLLAADPSKARTLQRDRPVLSLGQASLTGADPSKPAALSLFLGNDSDSKETRRYVVRSLNETNPYGAILKVNGSPIHQGLAFTVPAGQQVRSTLTVERGPSRYRYDSLRVGLYPECGGPGSVASFSVAFQAQCSDVAILHDASHELDFSTATPAAGREVILHEFSLETLDEGDPATPTDDIGVTELGIQYRRKGRNDWTPVKLADAADLSRTAISLKKDWTGPSVADGEGEFEYRAYTRCTAGRFVYSGLSVGVVDRTRPKVFGTPGPGDGVLSLGEDVTLAFNEPMACGSLRTTDDGSRLSNVALFDGATRIPVGVVCDGRSFNVAPEAGWAGFEGKTLTMKLITFGNAQPLTDRLGNPLDLGATLEWSFVVQRSAFAWSAPVLAGSVSRGVSPRFTVNLANGRAVAVPFTLTGVPAWLTPSLRAGTIAPGAVQPISFTGADTLSGGTHSATMQAVIAGGSVPLSLTVSVDATPSWTVDAAAFQHSMAVTAQLFLDGRPSTDAGDRVGAFVGGELRGVAHVTPQGSAQTPSNRVSLLVYSNAPSGEVVTFKVWDADATAPRLYTATSRTLAYQADAALGTPALPLAIHAPFVPGTASIALQAGWTWVSVPSSVRLSGLFGQGAGESLLGGDVVKGQRSFAMYSGTGGAGTWVGPLADTLLDPRLAYMVRLGASQNLPVTFADTASSVPLSVGWNWLGFPRAGAQPLSLALAPGQFSGAPLGTPGGAPSANDLIKSQTAFAQYVDGDGWVGSLSELTPGRGYMMKRAQAGTLAYVATPPGATLEVDAPALSESDAGDPAVDAVGDATGAALDASTWRVDASAFAFNMTIVAALDDASALPGMLVGAFSGDSLRGVANLRTLSGSPRPIAFLMAYANAASGERLAFRLLDPANGTTRTLATTQAFTADEAIGTVSAPLVLRGTATSMDAEAIPAVFSAQDPAPNPFGAQATYRYALPSAEHVTVELYDVMGRRVARLVEGRQEAGRYAVVVDGRELASGVYVLRLRAGAYSHAAQIVRVR